MVREEDSIEASTCISKPHAIFIIYLASAPTERVSSDGRRRSQLDIQQLFASPFHGRVGGHPKAEDGDDKLAGMVARLRSHGRSIRAIATEVKKSPNTILRLLKTAGGDY